MAPASSNPTATPLTEGGLVADDYLGLTLNPTDGIVTDMKVRCRYEKDRHTYMLGLTSPNGFNGNSVAFVQLASPTLLFIVDWTACKMGAVPEIPDPTINDTNWVLLDDHWEPTAPGVPGNNITGIYRISGCYVYGHLNPQDPTYTQVQFPLKSWMLPNITRSISPGKLLQGLSVPAGTAINPGVNIKTIPTGASNTTPVYVKG